jgi:hypothetical protein
MIRFYQGQRLRHAHGKFGTATRSVLPHATVYVLWDGDEQETPENPECVAATGQVQMQQLNLRDAWAERQVRA